MVEYEKIEHPQKGRRIQYDGSEMKVPDNPVIPYIRGDGIGPDIWKVTRLIIDEAVKFVYEGSRKIHWFRVYAGEDALKLYGGDRILPDDTLKAIRACRVAIKGPLTTPVGHYDFVCLSCAREQNGQAGRRPETCIQCDSPYVTRRFRSLNVSLRQILDLYACVRPVRWLNRVPSPVKHPEKLDVVIFRENTEDVYSGIEFRQGDESTVKVIEFLRSAGGKFIRPDSGIGIKPISVSGTRRLVKKAVEYAIDKKRKSVTLVHKGNIMKYTEGAFRDWGYELAVDEFRDHVITEAELYSEYGGDLPPGRILIKDRIADQMFQQVLLRPDEYDVIATPNLNGDYLSDACAAQVGGLGLAPGANIGDGVALFEATHGTAPKYKDQDKVNPTSLILSGVMMLDHLGWHEASKTVIKGLEAVIAGGRVTYDLARQRDDAVEVKCSEFGREIVKSMKNAG